MKTRLLLLLLSVPCLLFAQESFEEKQNRMQASVKMMTKANSRHDYLTVFTGGLELNFSHLRLLDFLYKHMQMSEKSNEYKNGYIISECVQRTSKGNPERLTIRYKVKSESGYFLPEQVEITGTPHRVIELFIFYWPTNIQFEDAKKGNEYTCYMLPDKVTLSIEKTGVAKIAVVHSSDDK
ncbi:MAG: hypothetical protein LBB85_11695 [Dysgonamonadaceae bacterium]|jgi:hypothetical protein|nr:hypothetical protein [Dysgonamonadaceae bacterium]